MKTILILFISLLVAITLQAQVSKTIEVTAGNLQSVFTNEELRTVTNLTLTGTMDALDFKTIGNIMPSLTELDLSGVKIVGDGTLVEAIPSNAFIDNAGYPNDHLKSIQLPLSCDKISDHAFSSCSGLTSLIIPRSVAEIGEFAFSDCFRLKSITFLSANASYQKVFFNCPNLSSIYLLSNSPYASGYNFEDVDKSKCTLYFTPDSYHDFQFKNVVEIPYLVPSANEVFLGAIKNISSTIDVLSDSTWTVSSNKSWLTVNPASGRGQQKITITADVNHLETCRTALLTFKIDTVTINSVVVNQIGTTKLINVSAGDLSSLTYEESQLLSCIRLIGPIDKSDLDVMKSMPWLSEINMSEVDIMAYDDGFQVFPANTIPENQFGYFVDMYFYSFCSKLKSIFLPYSCTSIGNYAFHNCIGLTSVTIPSSLTSIGNSAFNRCKGLTSIFAHPSSPVDLSSDWWFNTSFEYVDKDKCTFFVPYGSKFLYSDAAQWRDFNNIVEIPFIEVFKTQLNIAASEGIKAATKIVSDVNWTASTDQTWLTISQNTGIGDQMLNFIAEANPTSNPRTAKVTISAEGVDSQTITIEQFGIPTDVSDFTENLTQFKCYPNPFDNEITIEIQNPKRAEISVDIYNLTGERIKNLAIYKKDENLVLTWNGTNDSGQRVVSGVYVCKVNNQSKQLIYLGQKGSK
jgi:hypothetical protein